jgi:hypothetical protein
MAFGHEKLDSASVGMPFMRHRANTERQKSTPIPIPTPTPKEAMTGNRQPPAGGDGIPRLRRNVGSLRKRMIDPMAMCSSIAISIHMEVGGCEPYR